MRTISHIFMKLQAHSRIAFTTQLYKTELRIYNTTPLRVNIAPLQCIISTAYGIVLIATLKHRRRAVCYYND